MDLPTYTNIWRIEKRLYKLYDFRLPMPLPINWIAVFTGITVPYIVLLIAIGLPFNHTLLWLYVLPPGVLTWLTTRPVIESKRLPELIESQARYLTEPRTWVRLVPLSEKDQMVVTARAWRGRQAPQRSGLMAPSAATASMAATVKAGRAGQGWRGQQRQGEGRRPGGRRDCRCRGSGRGPGTRPWTVGRPHAAPGQKHPREQHPASRCGRRSWRSGPVAVAGRPPRCRPPRCQRPAPVR